MKIGYVKWYVKFSQFVSLLQNQWTHKGTSQSFGPDFVYKKWDFTKLIILVILLPMICCSVLYLDLQKKVLTWQSYPMVCYKCSVTS